jgi:hypothetical protein
MDYHMRHNKQRWFLDNKYEFYAWVYGRACAKVIGLEISDDIDDEIEEIFRLKDRHMRGAHIKALNKLKGITTLAEIAMENHYVIDEFGNRHASGDPTVSK